MTYIRQIIMLILALSVFLGLQYQYWFGENGHRDTLALQAQIQDQQQANADQIQANKVLYADVNDLKNGLEAVEEHARLDLGLIKSGETFVQMSTAPNAYSDAVESIKTNPEDAIEPTQ